ncbi:hypothetical protein V1508DRAFT_90009 [Lipomyces doorenjongii]|uniref:uncharacterized protein n=1 Tax=Lipomyces doorenjongii TaxID=383834 RepID=UPI0034CE29B7
MKFALAVEKPAQGSFWPSILVASFACFGGILYDYDAGSISGIIAMDHFKHVFATHHDASGAPVLTSSQISLSVSILSAGFRVVTKARRGIHRVYSTVCTQNSKLRILGDVRLGV